MPITYYSEEEYNDLKADTFKCIDDLIKEIKILKNERCNMVSEDRVTSCGECRFNGWNKDVAKCNSKNKYFCK